MRTAVGTKLFVNINIILLVFGISFATKCERSQEKFYKTILNGSSTIKRVGYPGTIIVSDDLCAQPILTSKHQTDVVIAGAVVGKGKVLAFAHNGYLNNFAEDWSSFYLNIKKWLVGGALRPDEIHDVTYEDHPNRKALASAKVITWVEKNYANKSDAFYKEIEKFMVNGGGVVIGATMWGHLQGTDLTVHDMSTNKFLAKFGLYYTILTSRDSGNYKVSENKASLGGVDLLVTALIQQFEDDKIVYSELTKDLLNRCYPWFSPEKKLKIQNQIETFFQCCPLTKKDDWPVLTPKMRVLVSVLEHRPSTEKLPGIQWYPGDFQGEPPRFAEIPISVTSTPTQKYYPTGYYAPAGQIILISRVTKSTKTDWWLLIGSHTDSLTDHSTLRRWPNIVKWHKISESKRSAEITSPYGGLIYLWGPLDSSHISLILSHVVKAPYFDLNDPKSVKDWPNRRTAPGLWADISGKFVTFTVPSGNIRDLKDPAPIMQFWDSLLESYYDLKGRNILEARKEWIVMDIQPSAGDLHSGHPIVAGWGKHEGLPYFLDYNHMVKNGAWGLYHELGHNVQEGVWTFDGTGEVTCNIFTLYGYEKLSNMPVYQALDRWMGSLKGVEKYLNSPDYEGQWKSEHGVALVVYAQLAHHFGWVAYKKVFRRYIGKNLHIKIKTDQEKIDQWVSEFSKVVYMNLAPLFEFWAIPVSDHVSNELELKYLPPFLPDDKFIRLAESRALAIRKKYFKTGP